jgi:ACS family sodium-dependent inorganic phosphate cotransporter
MTAGEHSGVIIGSTWGRRHTVLAFCFLAVVIGYTDRVNISVASVAMGQQFGWTQTTKGVVLSSFFVGYMLFMIASGWLAIRYGGKRVLTVAVTWWSVFTLLTPLAASISNSAVIAARIGLGLGEAAVFPASIEMLSRWAPAAERTRAIARLHTGIPVGQVVGFLTSGWLVGTYGWQLAFYAFGATGFVWVAVWLVSISNDPVSDSRISSHERRILPDASLCAKVRSGHALRRLLRMMSVWAIVAANFCGNWGLFFLLAWLPSYFRDVHHVSLASAGLLSAAPWVTTLVTANVAAALSDRAIAGGSRVIAVRKVVQGGGLLLAAIFMILCRDVHSTQAALWLVCGATGALGMTWSGYGPNALDISPRHAPLISAFSNTVATIPGIAGVGLTGWIVDTTGTYSAAFVLAAAVSAAGALFYIVFGSAARLDLG